MTANITEAPIRAFNCDKYGITSETPINVVCQKSFGADCLIKKVVDIQLLAMEIRSGQQFPLNVFLEAYKKIFS